MAKNKTAKIFNLNAFRGKKIDKKAGKEKLKECVNEAKEVFPDHIEQIPVQREQPKNSSEIDQSQDTLHVPEGVTRADFWEELEREWNFVKPVSDFAFLVRQKKSYEQMKHEYENLVFLTPEESQKLDNEVYEKESSLYGLEVLHAKSDKFKSTQHGWSDLYISHKDINISKRYNKIKAIRNMHKKAIPQVSWNLEKNINESVKDEKGKIVKAYQPKREITQRENRLYFFENGMIEEKDVYAWFDDLVFRQNNQSVVIDTAEGKKAIENLSGRWNKKRPFGYQIRKRLKQVCQKLENPILLTLTLSDKKIIPLMPFNTNMDPVIFAIFMIGKWIQSFEDTFYKFQKRKKIDWSMIGWAIEPQKENNNGFPHVHMIFDGKWLGDIREIEKLWGLGSVDYLDKKKLVKRYPGRKISSLRVANYLTKYVSKSGKAVSDEGVNKFYAWVAYFGARLFAVKKPKKVKDDG
jgi:hypothetical protein